MVTSTLPLLSTSRRKSAVQTMFSPSSAPHLPSVGTRPPPMPRSSTRSTARSTTSTSGGTERSTRSGSLYTNNNSNNSNNNGFSYPERRPPLRSADALSPRESSRVPIASANRHYVFVYGSLKRGFSHSRLMDRATYIGEFRTLRRYPLVVAGKSLSPYLLDIPEKGSRVKGEVYAVDDALLADLDHLERVGSGSRYTRRVTKVSSCADRAFVADVFIYFKSNELDAIVENKSGDESRSRRHDGRSSRSEKSGESSSSSTR